MPNLIEMKLHIGVEKPFRLIHISDTHLCYADLRDDERKVALAEKRGPSSRALRRL